MSHEMHHLVAKDYILMYLNFILFLASAKSNLQMYMLKVIQLVLSAVQCRNFMYYSFVITVYEAVRNLFL